MNLSNVETVNDLLALAAETEETVEPETDKLDEFINTLDVEEGYQLALKVIQRLGNFHQGAVETLKEEGTELDRLVVWVQDEQKLHTAYNLLNEVAENA
tara:strand:- start:12 stop:308 length:297 start_codon:yes stop_codon:yes gene_type:complete